MPRIGNERSVPLVEHSVQNSHQHSETPRCPDCKSKLIPMPIVKHELGTTDRHLSRPAKLMSRTSTVQGWHVRDALALSAICIFGIEYREGYVPILDDATSSNAQNALTTRSQLLNTFQKFAIAGYKPKTSKRGRRHMAKQ